MTSNGVQLSLFDEDVIEWVEEQLMLSKATIVLRHNVFNDRDRRTLAETITRLIVKPYMEKLQEEGACFFHEPHS